jgi:hypothetical protein
VSESGAHIEEILEEEATNLFPKITTNVGTRNQACPTLNISYRFSGIEKLIQHFIYTF